MRSGEAVFEAMGAGATLSELVKALRLRGPKSRRWLSNFLQTLKRRNLCDCNRWNQWVPNQATYEDGRHGRAVLTIKDVRTMRRLRERNPSLWGWRELAKLFLVSAEECQQICKRKRWKHVK